MEGTTTLVLLRTAIVLTFGWSIIQEVNSLEEKSTGSNNSPGCANVFPDTPTFGNGCKYRCHCANDDKCSSTGGCVNGRCAKGWMGPLCQYRNVMTNYVKVSQEGENIHHGPEFAIDGDVVTCSETNIGSYFGRQSWKVELDREYQIDSMKVFVKENDLGHFKRFRVQTGPSNTSFTDTCYVHPNRSATPVIEIGCMKPVVTKHIRIILDSENVPLRLCEVEIYNGREVAFNKPTTQSSSYAIWHSSKALDGRYPNINEAGDIEEQMCSLTGGSENNPWWIVDLQTEYVLRHIEFYGRISTAEQSKGLYISVGNTSAETKDIFHDESKEEGDPMYYHPLKINLTTQNIAKFVEVKLRPHSGLSALSICELHVFADCSPNRCGRDCNLDCYCKGVITVPMKIAGICPNGCSGRWTGRDGKCDRECSDMEWGKDCKNKCGNCKEHPCNIETGHCKQGCEGPWVPPLCVEGCEGKTYGRNCEKKCGNCLDAAPCNVTTGECKNGCEPGWQGHLCDTACTYGTFGKDCSNTCGHCLNGQTCNPRTGKCDVGCHPGYYGELCAEDGNILPEIKDQCKFLMSSVYKDWTADKAVDRSFSADADTCNCCAGTNNGNISFLKMYLLRMYPIQKLIIYSRENEKSFQQLQGFDLILGNSTGDTVRTVKGNTIMQNNSVVIELGNIVANSIEIRRPGKLTVCEIRLIEGDCPVGRFGDDCSRKCHCADKLPCKRDSGKCQAPFCDTGFTGPACSQVIGRVSSSSSPSWNFWLTVIILLSLIQ